MAKVKKITTVVKCQCSVCGQVSFVEEGTKHHYCRGIKLVKPLPALFSDLSKPDNKGTWVRWTPFPAELLAASLDNSPALTTMS